MFFDLLYLIFILFLVLGSMLSLDDNGFVVVMFEGIVMFYGMVVIFGVFDVCLLFCFDVIEVMLDDVLVILEDMGLLLEFVVIVVICF